MPRIVDVRTGTSLCTLEGHTDYIRGGQMLDEGTVLTWSNDKTLRVWKLDGTCVSILKGHGEYINSVLVLEGQKIASASGDETIKIWSWPDGICLTTIVIAGTRPSDPPRLACVNGNCLLATLDYRVVAVDVRSGACLYERKVGRFFPEVIGFDDVHFILKADSGVDIVRWEGGEVISTLPTDGWQYLVLPIGNERLLIADSGASGTKSVTFRTWASMSGEKLGEVEMGGEAPLSVTLNDTGEGAIVQMKDYRTIHLSLEPLKIVRTSGVNAQKADQFDSFAPEAVNAYKSGEKRLNVRWLDRRAARAVDCTSIAERPEAPKCGRLPGGKIVLRMIDQWRIYDCELNDYEVLSDALMEEKHPAYLQEVRWKSCLDRDAKGLAGYAADSRTASAAHVGAAIQNLRAERNDDHIVLTPGRDGVVLAHSPRAHTVWKLSDDGHSFNPIVQNDPSVFIHGELIVAADGTLKRWGDEGLVPLGGMGDDTAIAVHPDMWGRTNNHILRRNNHLMSREKGGVSVYSAIDGEELIHLDGGHGMGNWGLRELQGGPIVTWSRISLRSWDPHSYAPLVELQDPEDWGPGYEQVMPIDGKVVFFVGAYSYDSRIIIWDGGYGVTVYSGHTNEIVSVRSIGKGVFLSETESGQIHLWRANE